MEGFLRCASFRRRACPGLDPGPESIPIPAWIPAFAGMTDPGRRLLVLTFAQVFSKEDLAKSRNISRKACPEATRRDAKAAKEENVISTEGRNPCFEQSEKSSS
jgi:hypothetical protein